MKIEEGHYDVNATTALTFPAGLDRPAERLRIDHSDKTIWVGPNGWIKGPCEIGAGWVVKA